MTDVEIDLDEEFEWVDSDVMDDISDSEDVNESDSEEGDAEKGKRDIDLYRFIAAMSQAEYSFYSKEIDPHDLPFLSENLATNLRLAKSIAKHFDYRLNNLTHLYHFNILLRQVSYLSSAASKLGTKIEDILEDQDYISKIKDSNIEGVVILDDDLATDEVSLHIKSVLIPYSIYFKNSISSSFSKIDLEWYLELVIEITKTIATKWNKGINVSKRHLLFISSLDTVARFVLNCLYTEIESTLQKKLKNISISHRTIWDRIEKYSLGLNDYLSKKDIVVEKIESLVTSEINDFYLKHKTLKVLVSKDRVRLYLLEKLGDTWLSFHDGLISKLQLLSKSERENYFTLNNNLPNFDEMYNQISLDAKRHLISIQTIDINKERYIQNTKQKFSTLWGVSDAYCKTVS
jgi:ribosomal protein S8